jgi:hypothetical protein
MIILYFSVNCCLKCESLPENPTFDILEMVDSLQGSGVPEV